MKTKLLLLLLFVSSFFIFSQERVDESTLLINGAEDTDQVQNQEPINNNELLGTTDYLVVVLVLVFVIIALYFVLKFVKKIGGSRLGIDNDLIHILSTKALKGTTALHLVEVGNQVFLIGATDTNINAISEITDQESKDMISLNLSVDNQENKTFMQFFTDKLNKNRDVINENESESESAPDIKTQKEKLDRF